MISKRGYEIVNLINPMANFELLDVDNVPRVGLATGGLLQKSPIVCGGWDSQDCIVIGQPDKKIRMLEKSVTEALQQLEKLQNASVIMKENLDDSLVYHKFVKATRSCYSNFSCLFTTFE